MRPPLALVAPLLRKAIAALVLLLTVAGSTAATPPVAPVRAAAFDPAKLAAIDEAVARAIADRKIPGGVLWIERAGEMHRRVYGNRDLAPAPAATTEDTIYDAASLTKVLATAPAVALLIERGQVDPDQPLARYLPAFGTRGKEVITVR
ncbi:MAG: serine hydrolase domain-containing protein, partial [Opitutaceae bacterium]